MEECTRWEVGGERTEYESMLLTEPMREPSKDLPSLHCSVVQAL